MSLGVGWGPLACLWGTSNQKDNPAGTCSPSKWKRQGTSLASAASQPTLFLPPGDAAPALAQPAEVESGAESAAGTVSLQPGVLGAGSGQAAAPEPKSVLWPLSLFPGWERGARLGLTAGSCLSSALLTCRNVFVFFQLI